MANPARGRSRKKLHLLIAAVMVATMALGARLHGPLMAESRALAAAAADAADTAQNVRLAAALAVIEFDHHGNNDTGHISPGRLGAVTMALHEHLDRVRNRMADNLGAAGDEIAEAYLAMPGNTFNALVTYLKDLDWVISGGTISPQRLRSIEIFGLDTLHAALRVAESRLNAASAARLNESMFAAGAAVAATALLLWSLLWFGVRPIVAETESQSAELAERAVRDDLTGVFNRRRFTELFNDAVAAATTDDRRALVLVEIDMLDDINTIYGEPNGDEVLIETCARISRLLDDGEALGRISGGRFAVVLANGIDGERLVERIRSLREAIAAPVSFGGRGALSITASLGVAVAPDHGTSPDAIREAAREAMLEAQAGGRGEVRMVRMAMLDQIKRRRNILAALDVETLPGLRSALQPKIDAATGGLAGCEALGRWRHETLGDIPPDEFLTLATQHGQIDKVGAALRSSAMASFSALRRAGVAIPRLALNISHAEMHYLDAQAICEDLAAHGLVPADITIEIVEDVALKELSAGVLAEIRKIRQAGAWISLDDFGSGVSSLRHLGLLEIDEVKIDRALVTAMLADRRTHALVASIIDIAHRLQARVTAEGVETQACADELARLGCDTLQGWLYGKAMDEREFAAWWRAWPGTMAGGMRQAVA